MVEGMLWGGRECVCVGFGQGGGSTGGMPTTWGVDVVVDIDRHPPPSENSEAMEEEKILNLDNP